MPSGKFFLEVAITLKEILCCLCVKITSNYTLSIGINWEMDSIIEQGNLTRLKQLLNESNDTNPLGKDIL